MEWIFIGIAVVYILGKIIAASEDTPSYGYEGGPTNLGELNVRTYSEYADLDDGEKLELFKTVVSGNLMVPYAGTECRLIYSMMDVTEPDEPLPVVCYIEDFTDGDSPLFFFATPFTVQYQFSDIDGMEMPPVPPASLYLGKRGKRKLRLTVHIVDAADEEVYGYGETFTTHHQKDYGYTEQGERNTKTDRAIAALGLAICAGDGHIDKREIGAVKRYFSEQFTGIDEEDLVERKAALNAALKELLTDAKENVAKLSVQGAMVEIRRRAKVIAEFDSDPLNQVAFQLAIQIVAADEQVEESELKLIKVVADELNIPSEVDQEMRDRYFKLAMFEKEDRSTALNMPGELSADEQKEFLNREYEKWRRRVTHSDPKVREEATARLEAVTKARRELEDG